jgi:hypothetical protein
MFDASARAFISLIGQSLGVPPHLCGAEPKTNNPVEAPMRSRRETSEILPVFPNRQITGSGNGRHRFRASKG